MNNIFGNLFGTNPYQQSLNVGQSPQQAIQQSLISGLGLTTQQQMYAQLFERPTWVFNGQPMTLSDFATRVYGEDTPERTMFLLQYAEINQGEKR